MKSEHSIKCGVAIMWLLAASLGISPFQADTAEIYQVPSFPVATAAQRSTQPASAETRTEQWLKWQVDGRGASPTVQTASPQERELANQRLLDSYSHPIPEFFDRDAAGGEIAP